MNHSGLYHFAICYFCILHHLKMQLQTLLKEICLPHHLHHLFCRYRQRNMTDFSLCYKHAHDWILLTLKNSLALLFFLPHSGDMFCLPLFKWKTEKSITCLGMLFVLGYLTTVSHTGRQLQVWFCLWVFSSVWWHIPKLKSILFCCHETFPQQSTHGESETTFTDLKQNLDAGGNFQEVQIVNNLSSHFFLCSITNFTVTFCLLHFLY